VHYRIFILPDSYQLQHAGSLLIRLHYSDVQTNKWQLLVARWCNDSV